DDVLESPEIMIGVVEGLPRWRTPRRIGLTADEIRLPRAHGGDAGHLLDLALRRHWVGGFRSRSGEHEVDLVADDQLLGNFGRAVWIRLAVLDDDLHRIGRVADLDPVFHRALEV